MSKGKKFTAAEKHFHEKEVKLKKDMQYWQDRCIELAKRVSELEYALHESKLTIQNQSEWIERLLQYTELDLTDIRAACEKDKKLAEVASMMCGVSRFLGL